MIETAFLFQAALIIVWWAGTSLSESLFAVFQLPGIGHEIFPACFIPVIAFIVILSIIRAYGKSRWDLRLLRLPSQMWRQSISDIALSRCLRELS